MCGIAGLWSSRELDIATVNKMIDPIRRRGPDDVGFYNCRVNNFGFCHARLSILDVSTAGSQPMLSHCGRYVLTYNGEIYNHLEVRKYLRENYGFNAWNGSSDTETLVEAIAFMGVEHTLKLINGMFAFGVFDRSLNNLTVARDFFGQKPVYFFNNGAFFGFGSELSAFKHFTFLNLNINQISLNYYYSLNYIPAPLTIYSGVYKLKRGSFITVEARNGVFYHEFSTFSQSSCLNTSTVDARSQSFEEIFTEVVGDHLISDVKIGSFLSGGYDSTAIAIAASSLSSSPLIDTFSLSHDDPDYIDESFFAEKISKHLGLPHTTFKVTNHDLRYAFDQIGSCFSEPFADISQIPTFVLSNYVSKEAKVALMGDGGDEHFLGYNRYNYATKLWFIIQHMSPFLRAAVFRPLLSVISSSAFLEIIKIFEKISGVQDLGKKMRRFLLISSEATFFNFLSYVLANQDVEFGNHEIEILTKYSTPSGMSSSEIVSILNKIDFDYYLPDDILVKIDRCSMYHGLEGRAPFLDPRVKSFVGEIEFETLFRPQNPKWIIKEMVHKNVPRALVDRPKQGFGFPFVKMLQANEYSFVRPLLEKESIYSSVLSVPECCLLWARFQKGEHHLLGRIWNVLMFKKWESDWM